MAKTAIITILLILVIVLLVYTATRQPATFTVPAQPTPEKPQVITPRATPVIIGEQTPRAPELKTPAPGIEIEKVLPAEVNFWVNDIRVPPSTRYAEGLNYIPVKEKNIKTFAGSFGPYFENPVSHMRVVLCAEYYKVPAAPACEVVPLVYQDKYVTFARGYQFDEYIGGMAAKDYIAYFTIYAGETPVGYSNKAVIRTVKD
ncbi:MAG: hypothetical protein QW165_01955 [Candidatus Woesearchaeota archaeon]